MFRCELTDPNVLKTSFNALTHLLEEITLRIDGEGVVIRALNKSHAVYALFCIKKDTFDDYVYNEPVTATIDSDELIKALKKLRADDTLCIEIDEHTFTIILESESRRKFMIKLIDSEYEAPEPPEMEHPLSLDLPTSVFKEGIDIAELYGEFLSIRVDEDRIYIISDNDLGEGRQEYIHGIRVDKQVESRYNVNLLKSIMRAEKFSEDIKLCLGNDMPLKLTYEDFYNSKLQFLLAHVEINDE